MEAAKPLDNYRSGASDGRSISMNDYVLWKEFKSGDLAAYATIYRKYFFALYNYGRKLSTDQELIKDCIQELFVKIWNNRENLNETTSIKYYLFTSLKRKLLDVLKSPHMRLRTEDDFMSFDQEDDTFSEEEIAHWQKEKIQKALSTLSGHQQKLLHMKFYKELSNKEISDELGITIQSVYNAVFKALRSLRKQMQTIILILLSFFML
ncbi:MAG TPA: sigma-70 family RNA polymerase sigma factor [Ohtaekwangia sp.]|uniref:RNA polymerase sigma factor n=1 Tax=Ohtaekwangia sp. TaxID=2066019 RepID=UPI002F940179